MRPQTLIRSLATVVWIITATIVCALETDQYYAWGRPLADSTDVINAKFNLELERVLADIDTAENRVECEDIAIRLRQRLRFVLFHHIQLWALNSSLVARIPADAGEELEYRKVNLYHNHGPLDTGTWMPFVPTIEVDGVRFGTDKISHLVSSGWTYYSTYKRALRRGKSEEEAVRTAVRRGILEERLILGALASGVFSLSDLEASFQGMRFYRDMCHGADPVLEAGGSSWVIRRPIDLRDYVTPEWDESFTAPIYNDRRWRKVKPVLEQYCDRLDDPEVQAMLQRYRARDRQTVVEQVVADLVEQGELPDPLQFSLKANCPDRKADSNVALPSVPTSTIATPKNTAYSELKVRIVAEEQDRETRFFGLAGVQLTYPQVVAASIGAMLARLPSTYDCRTECDLWGPFAQFEPGLAGGKLSLGYGRIVGEKGHNRRFLSKVYLAGAFKATVLRTWGEHGPEHPGQTAVGAEGEIAVARVNLSFGLLYRVDGYTDNRWLITGGLGWGF